MASTQRIGGAGGSAVAPETGCAPNPGLSPREEFEAELTRVLSSAAFRHSQSISKLLRTLVCRALDGEAEALKESLVGVEVFGREPDYDTQDDPIVRVTARRLRAKLLSYYEGEGAGAAVRIELPSGAYVPRLCRADCPGFVGGGWTAPDAGRLVAPPAILGVPASEPYALAASAGHQRHPAFSVSGDAVAFDWKGPGDVSNGVYLQLLGADSPARLSPPDASDWRPVWTPDGGHIVCLRKAAAGRFEIRRMPVFGLGDRMLGEVRGGAEDLPRVDVSPDGRLLAASERPSPEARSRVVLIALETGQRWRVAESLAGSLDCDEAVFSPDSRTLAFRAGAAPHLQDVYLLALDGDEEPYRLTFDDCPVAGLAWDAAGKSVVVASRRGGGTETLWRFPLAGGDPFRVTRGGRACIHPAISGRRRMMAYVCPSLQAGIWSAGVEPGCTRAALIVDSAGANLCPSLSPGGGRLAFCWDHSGHEEIWTCSADGRRLQQATHLRGSLARSPRWSPDGQTLAFAAIREGVAGIFIVPASAPDFGTVEMATPADMSAGSPAWSVCGRFLYFASKRSGHWEIWKCPSSGGAPAQITRSGGRYAAESACGQFLYYTKGPGAQGVWRMPLGGETEELAAAGVPAEAWGNWTVDSEGVYFLDRGPDDTPPAHIRYHHFSSGLQREVARLHGLPAHCDSGLSLCSADGRLVYSQVNRSTHVILLQEGFL